MSAGTSAEIPPVEKGPYRTSANRRLRALLRSWLTWFIVAAIAYTTIAMWAALSGRLDG